MKIVAWVPIKMNNERLPGKNILPLSGKPLCQHVLGELLKLDGVDKVYAFCSEEEIVDYIQEDVIRVPRDESLNTFSTKINDVILAFTKAVDADIYVYAQVTSPFLKKESIERGLKAVLSGEYDSALSVKALHDFLWKDSKPFNYDPSNIARTQDLEPFYQETGGFYIYTKELIEQHNRRTGFKPYFTEVSEIEAVDIDYPEDYDLAQSIVLKERGRINDGYNISILAKWIEFVEKYGSVNGFFEAFGYKTCAIYGAGVLGSLLFKALKKEAVTVKYFIDSKVSEYGGLRCVKPCELAEQEAVDVIIITPGFDYKKIMPLLKSVNTRVVLIDDLFKDVYYYYQYNLTDVDVYADIKKQFIKEYTGLYDGYAINAHYWEIALDQFLTVCAISQDCMSSEEIKNNMNKMCNSILSKDVSIPILDLVITTKCSLKCKKCFHLIPSYTKNGNTPFDVDLEDIEKDLNKLLASVDFIMKVNILGGEPFLYERLDELLVYSATCKKVGYFNIVTNATIIPNDDICELLRDKKFHVLINDYGTPNGKSLELAEKLRKFGVVYYVMPDRIWYDFGDVKSLDLNEDELKRHFSECNYSKCKSLMEGELHTCGFHKHGQRTGLIPEHHDSLRIHEYTDAELKNKVIDFYKAEYFRACDYCNAPNQQKSAAILAGEQE